jgi:glycosyltransferase involved in cell wall biosynthesis
MKVAVIIDTWFPVIGGGQINTWEISKRIAREGHKIDIITRNNGDYHKEKVRNLKLYRLGQNSEVGDNISRPLFLLKSFFLIQKNNYDIIHLQAFLPGVLSPFLRNLLKKPTIFTVHGTRMFEQNPRLSLGFLLEKIILTKIKYDTQISVTKAFLKFKNINKQIIHIPNSVDLDKFERIKVKKANYLKILWVGRFDPVKRLYQITQDLNV